jgi:hypothetical protein
MHMQAHAHTHVLAHVLAHMHGVCVRAHTRPHPHAHAAHAHAHAHAGPACTLKVTNAIAGTTGPGNAEADPHWRGLS